MYLWIFAARLAATNPLSARNASCRSMRGAATSLVDWLQTQTTFAPGKTVSLGPSMTDQWLKWMSMASSLRWRPLSGIWVTGLVTVPLSPDAAWPGDSSGNYCLSSLRGTSLLGCMARYTEPVPICLWSTVVKHGDWTPPTGLHHVNHTMFHWICSSKDQGETTSAPLLQKIGIKVGGWDSINMYNVPCPVSNLSQTYCFLDLQDRDAWGAGVGWAKIGAANPIGSETDNTLI